MSIWNMITRLPCRAVVSDRMNIFPDESSVHSGEMILEAADVARANGCPLTFLR